MPEQIKKIVLQLAKQNNFGKLNSFTQDKNYTFTDKMVEYTSYYFCFKKKESFFYKSNYVQVDFIEDMVYIYNPINNETYYYSYFSNKNELIDEKKEMKQWIK